MANPRYVEVSSKSMQRLLEEVGRGVQRAGGKTEYNLAGREIVFDVLPPKSSGVLRVFTSLAHGEDTVRDCGADAVRLVVGALDEKRFRPSSQSRRIYRTAPTHLPHDEREKVFLERLREAMREEYARAMHVPTCPACARAMIMRKGKSGMFWGCAAFPKCKQTQPCRNGRQ